ncbi:MAG: PH domain-containing protein [Clostridium sp.]|nr:PH domain-containing protein [Clostridium sp.]
MINLNKILRNHFFKIFYSFGKMFKELISIVFAWGFLMKWIGVKLGILAASGMIVLIFVYYIVEWRKNIFIIKDKSIYHKEGVFNVKEIEIPLKRINTVDISRGPIEEFFKVSTIKIDNGNAKDHESELKFILNKDRAEEIRNLLLKRNKCEFKTEQLSYSLGLKELFIYSIISDSMIKGLGILFALQQFLDEYIKKIFKVNVNTSKYAGKFISSNFNNKIYEVFIMIFGLLFVTFCISIIYSTIKYYKFKLWTDDSKICINYGIIDKKNYSFHRKKIKGIHIKQSILMQVLGYFTIEIESIGYGDEKGEKAILYPICNRRLKDEILNNLLKEFIYEGDFNKPSNSVYMSFFYKKLIFLTAATCVLGFIKLKFILFGIPLFAFLFIIGHSQFKNTALGMNKDLVYIGHNIFTKTQSILNVKAVQSVTLSYNYFQHRRGICNYKFILYSSDYGKEIVVRNLTDNIIEEFFR